MPISSLVLFLIAIAFYCCKKEVLTLFSIVLIGTNCFGFVSATRYILPPADAILLIVLIISFFEWRKDRKYFSVKGDEIGILIFVILAFLFMQFIRTVILGIDNVIFSYKTVRIQGILLLYFFCRKMSPGEYAYLFKLILFFSVVQGVFYYLQPFGINILQGVNNDIIAEERRYSNIPLFAPYFILCFWGWWKMKVLNRVFWLLFFGGMVLLAQVRGVILSLGACILLAALFTKNKKKILITITAIFLSIIIVIPIFRARSQSGSSITDDIENVISGSKDGIDYSVRAQSGSMAIRLLMLLERGVFIVDNPVTALFGVGAIHEMSPANNFDFIFGTRNDLYDSGMCQIDSGDITWVPILLRYGFVGSAICVFFLVCWIIRSTKRIVVERMAFVRAACLMSVYLTITSFDTTLFDSFSSITLLCVFIGISNTKTNLELSVSRS